VRSSQPRDISPELGGTYSFLLPDDDDGETTLRDAPPALSSPPLPFATALSHPSSPAATQYAYSYHPAILTQDPVDDAPSSDIADEDEDCLYETVPTGPIPILAPETQFPSSPPSSPPTVAAPPVRRESQRWQSTSAAFTDAQPAPLPAVKADDARLQTTLDGFVKPVGFTRGQSAAQAAVSANRVPVDRSLARAKLTTSKPEVTVIPSSSPPLAPGLTFDEEEDDDVIYAFDEEVSERAAAEAARCRDERRRERRAADVIEDSQVVGNGFETLGDVETQAPPPDESLRSRTTETPTTIETPTTQAMLEEIDEGDGPRYEDMPASMQAWFDEL
jgi:hypothetical protein